MDFLKLNLILILLSSMCCCIVSRISYDSELVLVVALPRINGSGVSISWERGQEIIPGAIAAVDHINKDLSGIIGNKLILLIADSGLITSTDYPYSGNVLEVIANLTSQNTRIFGVVGLLHPKLLATLQSFQLCIASLIHFSGIPLASNLFLHDCIQFNSY